MVFTIITLFPQFFDSVFSSSIIGRAQSTGKIKIRIINLRDFGIGPHKVVDDKPYGGGTGMVLKVDVLARAIESARTRSKKSARGPLSPAPSGAGLRNEASETSPKGGEAVILLDPKGKVYRQSLAEKFSEFDHLILICGHYEGYDERIKAFVDYEISIGDFILSGGEIAAVLIVESVTRLVPSVLKKSEAVKIESFSETHLGRLLESPSYTRPPVYKRKKVPRVLLSGNFKKIHEFQSLSSKSLTRKRRPDLIY